MKKSHKGKDKLKVKVEVLINKVINLKEYNGGSVFVYWRRGTSKSSGETSHVVVRNGEALFEEKISFESKFFIDPKSQKPDEKKLSLQLKEEKKKSTAKVLGKIELDLTSYMSSRGTSFVNLSFTKGVKPEPVISCSFNTIPIKFNDKPLQKVQSGKDSSKDPRIVRTFGGDDYFLDKTDSEISDTTVDTSLATNEMTSNDYSDDDLNDDLGESKKELKQEIDKLTKDVDALENENLEKFHKIKDYENEIETLRNQKKKLQDDLEDRDKTIENYQFEKEQFLTQQMNDVARLSSNDPDNEIELLMQEKIEKMAIIANQEKEITKLKKQIQKTTMSNTELGNISGTDLRTKYQSLQQECEQQEKRISELERENAELSERLNTSQMMGASKRRDSALAPDPVITTNKTSANSSGSIEELRRQSQAFKQELEEKTLVERTIFLAEPQFKGNLPVSGITLFDGLVSLGVLKDIKIGTRVFSGLNMALETTYKKCQNDNSLLAYWLSTSCLLLAKVKNKIEIDGLSNNNNDTSSNLSPITSFEYNMKAIIFKFYSKLVQNAYLKLSPILVSSILKHDILAFNSGKLSKRKSTTDIPSYLLASIGSPQQNGSSSATSPSSSTPLGVGKSAASANSPLNSAHSHHNIHHHINSLVSRNTTLDILQEFFEILRQNYVHPSLINQFFSQLFYYINSLLLNSLYNIPDLCSTVNGFQIKIELSKIQDWVSVSHLSITQLEPMIEAANLLVMDKELLSDPDTLNQVCPSVSMYHIKHFLKHFQPDRINSDPIPDTVFSAIERLISARQEPLPETLEFDTTFMQQLSLDFLTKDLQYGRERKEITNISSGSGMMGKSSISSNSSTPFTTSSGFKR
ncbi:hypothetical protein CYY_005294 [Polysphondylium violaceum]|uniref:C2 NT-type domain-containing protein n=1 Tax=Polysphondylium violaceum TaxID=133409 RepID=A0A8J4USA3_9MYCE|nr:hypothetical protein CYY_005294 [Polysphondylium violaceum]